MRFSISCPFNCEEEEHEVEVYPEMSFGSLGWDGGVAEGEALPCGNIPDKKQFDELQQKIYERIIESAHPDP